MVYPKIKETLVQKFGLSPDRQRLKFRDCQKQSSQNWVDYVEHFCKSKTTQVMDGVLK